MVEHIHQRMRIHQKRNVNLTAYSISNEHFWLLIELSGIRSEKIIISLKEYLVDGFSKREVCERHDVSLSYFSLSLKKLSHIHNIASLISEYYSDDY